MTQSDLIIQEQERQEAIASLAARNAKLDAEEKRAVKAYRENLKLAAEWSKDLCEEKP